MRENWLIQNVQLKPEKEEKEGKFGGGGNKKKQRPSKTNRKQLQT